MKHLRSTLLSGALAVLGVLPLGTSLSHAFDTSVMAGADCFSPVEGSFRTGGGRLAYGRHRFLRWSDEIDRWRGPRGHDPEPADTGREFR